MPAGKYEEPGKVVDRVGREMTRLTHQEVMKISRVQDEQGSLLARHSVMLTEIDTTLGRHGAALKEHGVRLETLDTKVDQLSQAMDRRFESVDRRFESMDRKMDGLSERMDGLSERMEGLSESWGGKLESVVDTVDEMEAKVDLIIRHLGIFKD